MLKINKVIKGSWSGIVDYEEVLHLVKKIGIKYEQLQKAQPDFNKYEEVAVPWEDFGPAIEKQITEWLDGSGLVGRVGTFATQREIEQIIVHNNL